MTGEPLTPPRLPFVTRLSMITRLFAIQGAWNYETLLGNGVGFCIEPALRLPEVRLQPRDAALALIKNWQFELERRTGYALPIGIALTINAELNRPDVAISLR